MDQNIKSVLQPGETVKWSGRPQDVKLMEGPYGMMFIIRVVCAVVIAVLGAFLAKVGAGATADPTQMTVFMLVCFVIALYLVIDPLYVLNKMNKTTFYYITDRRVITCYGTEKKVKKMKMRTLEELGEVSVDRLSNGKSLIYMGKKTKRAPRLARTQFAFTDVQDQEEHIPLMFYSIDDVKGALNALPAGLCR